MTARKYETEISRGRLLIIIKLFKYVEVKDGLRKKSKSRVERTGLLYHLVEYRRVASSQQVPRRVELTETASVEHQNSTSEIS